MDDSHESAIVEARRLLAGDHKVAFEGFRRLIRSSVPEVRLLICEVVVCTPLRIRGMPKRWRDVVMPCVPELVRSLTDGQGNDDGLSRYDIAAYLRKVFDRLWAMRAEAVDELDELRAELAKLCCSTDKCIVDVVVTGVLEHLFCDQTVRDYFRSWDAVESLAPIYAEACRLADGFVDQRPAD